MKRLLILVLPLMGLFACQEVVNPDGCEAMIRSNLKYQNAKSDDFDLVEARIEDDCLLITVRYGGGFNVPKGRPLADFLPTITINAKALAADITNANIQQKDLKGEEEITGEHIDSNLAVRKLLKDQANIRPEDLPAAEDLKKLERRVKTSEKKLAKGSKSLKGKSEEEE